MKRIVLVKPRYPYGRNHIFMNGSLISIGAQLHAMGYEVDILDLNIDRLEDPDVKQVLNCGEIVGISLTGAPDIPGVLELIPRLHSYSNAPILLGGQVIERLTPEQFNRVFVDVHRAVQIRNDTDLTAALDRTSAAIPSFERFSYQPIWNRIGAVRMTTYLRTEGTLVISQGCHFRCAFCAASKSQKETFRDPAVFTDDLRYLCALAKQNGIARLEFYASSLDFFQNPLKVQHYLEILAQVQEETHVPIRVRCLSCMTSFLHAYDQIPHLATLLRRAGLWCIGFGADGTDSSVWRAQRKSHNTESDLQRCLQTCDEIGVRAELLMVLGFPEDTFNTLWKTVLTSILATVRWRDVIIRPYLAKPFVPGNEGWRTNCTAVKQILSDPHLFYNLDFASIGSRLTHPNTFHRLRCNAAYLLICALLSPVGKCTTSPLLPQGNPGMFRTVAKLFNRFMPFDR